jgi:uncharacterized phage protein gp47/JayE
MPYVTPDFQAIRDGILRDISNQPLPDGTPRNVAGDSDYAIRANATGSAIEGLYQHQQWIARQILPDSSDPDWLERHASLRGLFLKKATVATGSLIFQGTPSTPVPIGTEQTYLGLGFVTTAAGVIGTDGTATIDAQATQAGSAYNLAAGMALTLTSAPSDVLSTATVSTMSGGTDLETYPSLLSRLLFVMRNPPCGGAAHDYYTWAMNVPGVTAAYVYSNRRGLGTTDVIIITAGATGPAIPDAPLVAAAQSYIGTQCPVQADFLAFAPTPVPANPAASLVLAPGYTLADVGPAITAAQVPYFARLKPGDTAYLKRISAIISDTAGVVDFALAEPTGNVVARVDATHTELAVLGTPAWS